MPTSHWNQLNEIVGLIKLTDPQSVLDIGVGFGKFGVLAREYLELWDSRNDYVNWTRRIDGVEVHEEYRNPIHKQVYSQVFYGDARLVVPELDHVYDLILLIDVLEHFTRDEGLELLESCRRKSNNILISTPHGPSAQGAAFGNEHETHRSTWNKSNIGLPGALGTKFTVSNPKSLIYFWGVKAEEVCPKAANWGMVTRTI